MACCLNKSKEMRGERSQGEIKPPTPVPSLVLFVYLASSGTYKWSTSCHRNPENAQATQNSTQNPKAWGQTDLQACFNRKCLFSPSQQNCPSNSLDTSEFRISNGFQTSDMAFYANFQLSCGCKTGRFRKAIRYQSCTYFKSCLAA